MNETQRRKRILCYLKALAGGCANLEETADRSILLMRIAGVRSLKLSRGLLLAMAADGLVSVRNAGPLATLSLTDAGMAALRRKRDGSGAARNRKRAEVAIVDTGSGTVRLNLDESPLAALARLKRPDGAAWLEDREIAAGERLRIDFEKAMLQPRVTASWDPARVAQGRNRKQNTAAELSDTAQSARCRVNAAVKAVGPELAGVLLDACCFLKGLEQVEREQAWPRRSAKLMLKTALGALDRHYHPPARDRDLPRSIRHWGSDDFRPVIG